MWLPLHSKRMKAPMSLPRTVLLQLFLIASDLFLLQTLRSSGHVTEMSSACVAMAIRCMPPAVRAFIRLEVHSCAVADSDGKISQFISPAGAGAAPVLPLHELPGPGGEPYLLAMFLTGAYQEV